MVGSFIAGSTPNDTFASPSLKKSTHMLQNYTATTMLANSEFVALLRQAPTDLEKLSEVINISPEQLKFVRGPLCILHDAVPDILHHNKHGDSR